jgi:hypothetical protein
MKLFELFESKQQLSEDLMVAESIQLCTSVIALLENFDWEPQPEFRGVGGETRASGAGIRGAKLGQQQSAEQKLNAVWKKLLLSFSSASRESRAQLSQHLQKLADLAAQKGLDLDPNPEQVLGRVATQFA